MTDIKYAEWYRQSDIYNCALCGGVIERTGYDPCQVVVESHREDPDAPGYWWFSVHAACVPRAFEPGLRADVEHEYDYALRTESDA